MATIPVKEFVAWAIAISALIWGVYSIARGSPLERVRQAEQLFPQTESPRPSNTDARAKQELKPEIERIVFWHLGFGVGAFAEGRNPEEPQRVLFQLGTGEVLLKNVVISDLGEKIITMLLLGLYSLAIVLCLHPPARLLQGRASFASAIRLGFIWFFSSWVLVTGLVLCGCVLLLDAFRLKGWHFLAGWMGLVIVPGFAVMIRCFFASFSELYQISKKRLAVVGIFGIFASAAIFPFVFLPCLYLILRFQELWKTLF